MEVFWQIFTQQKVMSFDKRTVDMKFLQLRLKMTTKEETGLINQHDAVEKDCKPTFKLIIRLCIAKCLV